MQTTHNIQKLFSDLYNGNPWTWINLHDIISDITADKAAKNPIPNANSIWQIVQHCIGWRENVLRKLAGDAFETPDDNYLTAPVDTSTASWQELLDRLAQSEKDWESYLANITDDFLNEPYAPSNGEYTVYEVIHGVLHHDNYHFGQIMMLKKLLM